MLTWREKSQIVISRVRQKYPEAEGHELKILLRRAYPFGERRMHPYKVWLEEVNKVTVEPTPKAVINFWVK